MLDSLNKSFGSLSSEMYGGILGWSEEYKKYLTLGYKCPECSQSLLNSAGFVTKGQFYDINGNKLAPMAVVFNRSALLECENCHYRWPVFKNVTKSASKKFYTVDVVETHRSEESLGIDQRLIDNSKSSTTISRRFSVSKEWAKTYSIECENSITKGAELNLGLNEISSIKLASDDAVRKQYSIASEERENYEEGIEVEVPAHTKLCISFHWKRIWQHGFIRFRNDDNLEFQVPFQIVVGVTFDQAQIDEN